MLFHFNTVRTSALVGAVLLGLSSTSLEVSSFEFDAMDKAEKGDNVRDILPPSIVSPTRHYKMLLNSSRCLSFVELPPIQDLAVYSLSKMFRSILPVSVAALLTFLSLSITAYQPPKCKAVPGSAAWPCHGDWDALNRTIDGRLLKPLPTAAVCHPDEPDYNPAICKSADWTDAETYVNDPIGILNPNWSNDSCLPQPQYPCSGEGFPVYVVNASSSDHVAAGINFARKHNVRLNVKGSGHDYLGRYFSLPHLSMKSSGSLQWYSDRHRSNAPNSLRVSIMVGWKAKHRSEGL